MENAERKEFGRRLRERRTIAGYSREALGELCGKSARHLANVEKGERACSVETLAAIATQLSCSVDYLLFGETYYEREVIRSMYDLCSQLNGLTQTLSDNE